MAKYRREKIIGSGGFGEVWKGVRDDDKLNIAMKWLNPGVDAEGIARFRREVRILQSLEHGNIVDVLGVHIAQAPYWFAMPLFDGSLRDIIDAVVADEALRDKIILQLLDGIEYAHSNGVIHRDLKPENVLYTSGYSIVISDFGLGRILNSDTTRKTYTGQAMGTPYYMAPEQLVDAKNATALSDIYSIGRIIYELYTGDPPAAQQDLTRLSPGMSHVVAKCTKRGPSDRYQSISDLRRDYQLVRSGKVGARPKDDFRRAVAGVLGGEGSEGSNLAAMNEALLAAQKNIDDIREMLVDCSEEVLAKYMRTHEHSGTALAHAFAVHVRESNWGFDYCDVLANALAKLYRSSEQSSLRAEILVSMMVLGTSHNRWYVTGLFKKMIESITNEDEVLCIAELLPKFSRSVKALGDVLTGASVAAAIREAAQTVIEDLDADMA